MILSGRFALSAKLTSSSLKSGARFSRPRDLVSVSIIEVRNLTYEQRASANRDRWRRLRRTLRRARPRGGGTCNARQPRRALSLYADALRIPERRGRSLAGRA